MKNCGLRQATALSFALGAFCATGVIVAGRGTKHGGLAIYLSALSLFHFLEFWLNPDPTIEAFLLSHSPEYTLALSGALFEYFLEAWLFPSLKFGGNLIAWAALVGVIGGQVLRSWAMSSAGDSFSHVIKEVRKPQGKLVTDSGPFRWLRHPSYAGFLLWALSLQLVLRNPLMLIAYGWILFHFFRDRIKYEERLLVQMYGERYEQYRRSCWSGIPFIN